MTSLTLCPPGTPCSCTRSSPSCVSRVFRPWVFVVGTVWIWVCVKFGKLWCSMTVSEYSYTKKQQGWVTWYLVRLWHSGMDTCSQLWLWWCFSSVSAEHRENRCEKKGRRWGILQSLQCIPIAWVDAVDWETNTAGVCRPVLGTSEKVALETQDLCSNWWIEYAYSVAIHWVFVSFKILHHCDQITTVQRLEYINLFFHTSNMIGKRKYEFFDWNSHKNKMPIKTKNEDCLKVKGGSRH